MKSHVATRSGRIALGVSAILVLAVLLWRLYPGIVMDGVLARCFHGVIGDETTFSPGYSDHRFVKVRRGMHTDEVLSLLGEPLLRRTCDQARHIGEAEVWWYYSDAGFDLNKTGWRRVIVFKSGTVSAIQVGLYVD